MLNFEPYDQMSEKFSPFSFTLLILVHCCCRRPQERFEKTRLQVQPPGSYFLAKSVMVLTKVALFSGTQRVRD